MLGPGSRLRAGEVSIEVVSIRATSALPGAGEGESAAENDGSLVMLATVGGVRVLLAGDVQEDQRNALASGADLRANVLLVYITGRVISCPSFLAASRALAVFSGAGQDTPETAVPFSCVY